MNHTLAILLDELSQDFEAYKVIVERLKSAGNAEDYDKAETALYEVLSHLSMHSRVLLGESLEKHSRFTAES